MRVRPAPAPAAVTVPADWPATEAEARAVQDILRARVDLTGPGPEVGAGTATGVDVAYDDARGLVAAAAVVLDAATLQVVEEATAVGPVPFPYVPGLLAFRELPAVLVALAALAAPPGLVVCDGYGVAHPRRFGLASHLGVLTGLPAVGVAKNPFTFTHEPPANGAATRPRSPTAPRRSAAPCAPAPPSDPSTSPPATASPWTAPSPTPSTSPPPTASPRPPAAPTPSAAPRSRPP